MDVKVSTAGRVHVVTLSGELDANTSPVAYQQIRPLATEGARILLDMAGVAFMSSAGLRLLLTTYREVVERSGKIALAGLSDELQDTMSATGFLSFFTIHDNVEAGLRSLQVEG